MAIVKQIRDSLTNKKVFPVTHVDAIYTDDSNFLGDMIDNGWGTQWYTGTNMSGTVTTTGYYSYSACPQVKLNDIFLNTLYGYIYQCTTAGSGTTARWTYKGSIRGATGGTGGTGPQGTRGTRWNTGTACTGTSASDTQFSTGISDSIVGDMYLNTSIGYVYKCTVAGGSTVARWIYVGSIKGADAADYIDDIGSGAGSYKVLITKYMRLSTSMFEDDYGTVVIEGAGTTPVHLGINDDAGEYVGVHKTLIFKNCKVTAVSSDGIDFYSLVSIVFDNCTVMSSTYDGDELYKGKGDITFINCSTFIKNKSGFDGTRECGSGISKAGTVKFIGGSVDVAAGDSDTVNGFDSNLIYSCENLIMSGVTITTSGNTNGRVNLIHYCKKAAITGCHICLNGLMHSITHNSYSNSTSIGSFTGNYVEYYKTYIAFGAVTGNTFIPKASGTSSNNYQIILKCPTNMSDNDFGGGYGAYINAYNYKVIVDRNMYDTGLTVGSAASGSITTNNLQY